MKLGNAISQLDVLRPGNPYSNDIKTDWINSLEGRIQTDVWLMDADEILQYDYEKDQNRQLLVRPPHDDIYGLYLQTMVDFSDGEYLTYQNTMAMFNAFWSEYVCHFANTYNPAQSRRLTVLGTVEHDADPGETFTLYRLPPASILLRVMCRIETAFNSGMSDELTLGIDNESDALLSGADIDETKPGVYYKTVLLESGNSGAYITATLTKTGTNATEGRAVIYGHVLIPKGNLP